MGRYTLKELAALREERLEEREAALETTESTIARRRHEHIAERRWLHRLEQHEHIGHAEELQGAEDTQRALLVQAEAQAWLQSELREGQAALVAETESLRASHLAADRARVARAQLQQQHRANIDALRRRLVSEELGLQKAAHKADLYRRAAVDERKLREYEAQVIWEHAGRVLVQEEDADRLRSETVDVSATAALKLQDLQSEAANHEQWAQRERILLESRSVRHEMDVYAYQQRNLSRRHVEQSQPRQLAELAQERLDASAQERLVTLLP